MTPIKRAERYCAYQERSTREVSRKLDEWKVGPAEKEKILAELREEGYLDDERFARSFASGKLRIKRWGARKIRMELKLRGIAEPLINKALKGLEQDTYAETIQSLIRKKKKELQGKPAAGHQQKIYRFLVSKGFEPGKVIEEMRKFEV